MGIFNFRGKGRAADNKEEESAEEASAVAAEDGSDLQDSPEAFGSLPVDSIFGTDDGAAIGDIPEDAGSQDASDGERVQEPADAGAEEAEEASSPIPEDLNKPQPMDGGPTAAALLFKAAVREGHERAAAGDAVEDGADAEADEAAGAADAKQETEASPEPEVPEEAAEASDEAGEADEVAEEERDPVPMKDPVPMDEPIKAAEVIAPLEVAAEADQAPDDADDQDAGEPAAGSADEGDSGSAEPVEESDPVAAPLEGEDEDGDEDEGASSEESASPDAADLQEEEAEEEETAATAVPDEGGDADGGPAEGEGLAEDEGVASAPAPAEGERPAPTGGDPAARAKHAQHGEPVGTTGYDALAAGTLFPEIPKKKSHKGLKAFGVTMGIFAAVLLVVYLAGIFVFSSRFLPHTTLGTHDISLRPDAEVVQLLQGDVENYAIEVTGDGFSYRALGADLGASIDAEGVVAAVHRALPAWKWPYYLLQPSLDASDLMDVSFKRGTYEQPLAQAIDEFNKTAEPPQNATIAYDEKAKKFTVKKEVAGTQIDPAFTMEAFAEAIAHLNPKLAITDEFLVQPAVRSDDEKLVESAKLASGMTSADLNLIMNGSAVRRITGADLSQFVSIDDKLDVAFDEAAMDAWCEEVADAFNTVGTERTYTRPDGKVVTVKGGVYGWEIDKDALKNSLIEGIKAGEKADVEVPFLTEAATFTAPGEPDWGKRYIDVDISEQHVRFYDAAGQLFWEADCITGTPDGRHNTVQGVWKLNDKESPSLLKGYENGKKIYETKVTFWMPFEGNSIGFHDATWQPGFGGSMYANGYGSHGCVNLSYQAAEELYGLIQEGDVVIVHS